MIELVVRFFVGGAIVSLFAAIGEMFKPKTFSGLFGAAPSVALASLALAFHSHGSRYALLEARFMILGAVAMFVYSALCVVLAKRERVPIWLGAGAAWIAWLATAFSAFGLVAETGLLP